MSSVISHGLGALFAWVTTIMVIVVAEKWFERNDFIETKDELIAAGVIGMFMFIMGCLYGWMIP